MDDTITVSSFWRLSSDGMNISGRVAWPYDPVFRPTVGVYDEGRLIQLVPTSRRRSLIEEASWECTFNVGLVKGGGGETITLACLESGEILVAEHFTATSELILENVRARCRRASPDLGGFLAFLRLPIRDQIRLVYLDYLNRTVDPGGLDNFCDLMLMGHMTILDVRDTLVSSEEFRLRRLVTSELAGQTIVWSGFQVLEERKEYCNLIIVKSPDNFTFAGQEDDFIMDMLCRLAMGSMSASEDAELWRKTHGSLSREMHVEIWPPLRSLENEGDQITFFGLENAMRATELGRVEENIVLAQKGKSGLFSYSQKLRLENTGYVLSSRIDNCSPNVNNGVFGVEIVHKDRILASAFIGAGFNEQAYLEHEFHFSVPVIGRVGARTSEWEIRYYSNGECDAALSKISLQSTRGRGDRSSQIDLLPLMSLSQGSSLSSMGIHAVGPGHAIYGPYRALIPGCYELDIVGMNSGSPLSVELEILSGDKVLMTKTLNLPSAEWRYCSQIVIEVQDGILEFRLSLDLGASLVIRKVALAPLLRLRYL